MTAALPTVCIDPDELLRMPNGEYYELIDGVPVEKNMGAESEWISVHLGGLLDQFVRRNDLGFVFGSNTNFVCFPNRPSQLRKPDAAFVAGGRFENARPPRGNIAIAPDLAVEVNSPNDLAEELEIKLAEYHQAGVRLIWVISPDARIVQVRRLDGSARILREADTLSGEDVIPGFEIKVADLFA